MIKWKIIWIVFGQNVLSPGVMMLRAVLIGMFIWIKTQTHEIFSDKSEHSKRSRLFKHHISGYHSQAKYKLHTLSFENENELAPVRCYVCNWFFFKYRDRKDHLNRGECSDNIAAIAKLKESGLWDKIKFKPNIRPKPIQVLDHIFFRKINIFIKTFRKSTILYHWITWKIRIRNSSIVLHVPRRMIHMMN